MEPDRGFSKWVCGDNSYSISTGRVGEGGGQGLLEFTLATLSKRNTRFTESVINLKYLTQVSTRGLQLKLSVIFHICSWKHLRKRVDGPWFSISTSFMQTSSSWHNRKQHCLKKIIKLSTPLLYHLEYSYSTAVVIQIWTEAPVWCGVWAASVRIRKTWLKLFCYKVAQPELR